MFDRSRLIKLNSISLFLLLSYIACWISISSSTIDIIRFFDIYKINFFFSDTSFQKIEPDLIEFINFLRQLIIIVIFPILIYLNIVDYYKNVSNKSLSLFALLLYFLFQIPGLIFTENPIFNIGFVISALNIILIFNLSNSIFDKKMYKLFIYVSLFFLLLISFLNKGTYIKFLEVSRADGLYLYFESSTTSFLDKSSPRSTGSSRTLLFIYIIFLFLFNEFFEKKKGLKIALYLILATLILLFQSRATILLLLVFLFFVFFIEKKFGLKDLIKFSTIHLLIPVLFLYSVVYLKTYEIIQTNVGKNNNIEILNENFIRPIDPSTFSSGRVNDWKRILNKTDSSLVFGYGSQADRFLIDQTASSGFIYAFSSSGIIGLIFYLFFLLICLIKILNILIFNQNIYSKKTKLCSIIVLICILRSFIESSIAVFGVDFIIFITFYNYIRNYDLIKKNA